MKNVTVLFIALSLTGFLVEVLLSNPDSETEEDNSSDHEQNQQRKSALLQDGYSQARNTELQRYQEMLNFRAYVGNLNGTHIKGTGFFTDFTTAIRKNTSSSKNAGIYPRAFPFPVSSEHPLDTKVNNSEMSPSILVNTPQLVPANLATRSRRQIMADSNALIGIINDFAFRLTNELNPKKNFVFSPFSIFVALCMCYLGSNGTTKAQIESALGLNPKDFQGKDFHRGVKDILSLLSDDSKEYELYSANAMFIAQNYAVNSEFKQDIQRFYDAEVKNLDFKDSEQSGQIIDEWVSSQTRNMITSLGSPPSPSTLLMLLNAAYFKGAWKIPFSRKVTRNRKFQNLDSSTSEVSTMALHMETIPYFRSERHRHSFIKLPYEGDEISMIIALPNDMSGKPMPSITDQILRDIKRSFTSTELDLVTLPKFRVKYSKSLKQSLKRLGISDMFDRYRKDFRGMRKENDLYVADVKQKAVLKVNELGAEGAAVSVVRAVLLSARYDVTNFVADHPFAFYIVHESSGLVLFYGKILRFKGRTNNSARNQA